MKVHSLVHVSVVTRREYKAKDRLKGVFLCCALSVELAAA